MAIDYKKEGKIAVLTLNRPEAYNAMDPETYKELSEVLADFKDDDSLWVGIITGVGLKAFCAGADVRKLLPGLKKGSAQPWIEPPTIMRGLNLWKPLIAAINGAALGGGLEICLACDIRIAAENATFALPEVTLGLIPAWGGTQRLPRVIPQAIAAEMLFTGRPINAQEAYRIGLVNKVVPQAELMPTAMQMAELLCKPSPLAVRAAKQAMIQGTSMSLTEGLELEKTLTDFVTGTEDFTEGCNAFLEKRKPEFKVK
jgi:enoyl-CoA hydratase/carnithine racemase